MQIWSGLIKLVEGLCERCDWWYGCSMYDRAYIIQNKAGLEMNVMASGTRNMNERIQPSLYQQSTILVGIKNSY